GHNKIKKKATLVKLLKLVKPLYPRADINYLTGKIGSLRSPFNREHNPVQDYKRLGAAANDIYVPGLWSYHSLRLLPDQTKPRPSRSRLPCMLPSRLWLWCWSCGEKRLGSSEDTKNTTPPKEGKIPTPQPEDVGSVVHEVGEIVTITGDVDVVEEETHFTSASAHALIREIMVCNRDLEKIKENINDVQQKIKNIIDVLGRI
ncbi:hypothetical protein AB205_0189850, partial [Aquarana catesbeiana]